MIHPVSQPASQPRTGLSKFAKTRPEVGKKVSTNTGRAQDADAAGGHAAGRGRGAPPLGLPPAAEDAAATHVARTRGSLTGSNFS